MQPPQQGHESGEGAGAELPAVSLPEADFAPETVEARFLRGRGGAGPDFGSNSEAAKPYSLAEGVWRPDGRGANETIYAPFVWKGRKVRALKPEPRFARGEQYALPAAENPDDYIGVLTGDTRFSGNAALRSKGANPDRFNRFSHLQRHARNGGGGGAVGEALFGTGEAQVARASRREQVAALLAGEGANVQMSRPRRLLHRAAEDVTAGALEALAGEDRVREFLLDPEANDDYNTLAMGAYLPAVNTTGDMNLAAEDDFTQDRGRVGFFVASASEAMAARAGAAMVGDTMNAVKVSDAQLRGVNQRGYAEPGDPDHGQGGNVDSLASEALQSVRDGRLTTDALYGIRGAGGVGETSGGGAADQEAPTLAHSRRFRRKEQDRGAAHAVPGGADEHAPRDAEILAHSRRQRVKEQERGGAHAAVGGGADEHAPRDAEILAHSRRQRVKEQERGGAHAAVGGGADEHAPRDAAILAHSRRQRIKEQDRGAAHAVVAGGADDHAPRDAAILAHSRRQRVKEQDRGGAHAVPGGADEAAPRDMAILAHSRRYRRKEQEGFSATANTGNVPGLDPLDWVARHAAPRAREASTVRRLDAALNPGAGNGEEREAEQQIVAEVPAQAQRAQRRAAQHAEFGIVGTLAPEFSAYAVQSAVDPHAPELLSRATQMAKTRDRRREQTQIAARGYDEIAALRDAYREDLAWMARGKGKLGAPALYESGDESGMESS
jgi:hypothetical protein